MGYGNYDNTTNTLEKALTPGAFRSRRAFQCRRCASGSAIGWAMSMKAIEPRPAFGAYLGRVGQRPAYQRAMAQSEAMTKKSLARSPNRALAA